MIESDSRRIDFMQKSEIDAFFQKLWIQYTEITRQAEKIHTLFSSLGNTIRNDHIAFRTYNLAPICIENLEPFILNIGFRALEDYCFEDKNLRARAYLPPREDLPKIFLSELEVDRLSRGNQQIISNFCSQISKDHVGDETIFSKGRLWAMPSWEEYRNLLEESEYAAWMSVMGLRANHFTVDIRALSTMNRIQEVIEILEKNGFVLNESGGKIKGNPRVLLEQCSTLADRVEMRFAGGDVHEVTSCYYEFAYRYPDQNGTLFQGFVTRNADRIFESTDQSVPQK